MPTIVWLLLWAVAIGTVAWFAIREMRAKRRGPDEFDRLKHDATREADLRSHTQGPNGYNQTWTG